MESLRPKRKPLPFEECSSNSSESEPDPPQQRVLARTAKPPLIFTTPGGYEHRPPAPSTTIRRPSGHHKKHAEDIKRANEVLEAGWGRQATRSRLREEREQSQAPHTLAPTSRHGIEKNQVDARSLAERKQTVAELSKPALRSHSPSQRKEVTKSLHRAPQSPNLPQRSRNNADTVVKRARSEADGNLADSVSSQDRQEIVEAGRRLFSYFEDEDD